MSKKRPWSKYARIVRLEYNSGDIKFETWVWGYNQKQGPNQPRGKFESLTEAETDLDAWWADWWPRQIKSSRRA